MKSPALFKEYLWLVNTLYKERKISFQEINEKWLRTEMSEGVELSRSTFNRHKDAIQEMFGIIIECDRRDGFRYYISNAEVLYGNTVQSWMLSMMSMGTLMKESMLLKDRILIDNVIADEAYMLDLVHSMKQGVCLEIDYQRYGQTEIQTYIIAPYCLKMCNRRWYVLGKTDDGKFYIFSVDRIKHISKTSIKFVLDKNFAPEHYFKDCYGVVTSNEVPCEHIVLRVLGNTRYYLRDLPLHHSQTVLKRTEEYSDITLDLRPTIDFMSEILSYGPYVKVMEPKWLADNIKKTLLLTAAMYDDASL